MGKGYQLTGLRYGLPLVKRKLQEVGKKSGGGAQANTLPCDGSQGPFRVLQS